MPNPDRFLGRAGVYATSRPTYTPALREWLRDQGLLTQVADIGAGTGLFTELLLAGGAQVQAVEPNREMRAQLAANLAEAVQAGRLQVMDGTSEHTGLPAQSIDLVAAAQAAHWFDQVPTVREFQRILRPGGHVLLLWNDWRGNTEPFNVAYGATVARFYRDGDDPVHINRVPESEIPAFMPGGYRKVVFENPVLLSRERLRGLAGSVSYLPHPTDPLYPQLTQALDQIFETHEQAGYVTLHYRTHVFLGQLTEDTDKRI